MRFEWDEAKNAINIEKHGIDFADVHLVFDALMLIQLDDREDYSEERWSGIGLLANFVTVVVYVERNVDVIRIISARNANKHERKRYEKFISDGLGAT